MLGLDLKTYEFCTTVIKSMIGCDGFAYTTNSSKVVLFYAGPTPTVLDEIPETKNSWTKHLYPLNWTLAASEANRLGAMRVDNTKIFPFLMQDGLEYAIKQHLVGANDDELKNAKDRVWDYVSAYYSRTNFKKAATMVCGAGRDSSFYKEEMYGMLENPSVEIINEKPVTLFQDFRGLGKDEVHRLMCITALMEMKAYAKASGDKAAMENYKRQRKYFIIARKADKKAFATQPKAVRESFKEVRKEILNRYQSDKAKGNAAQAQCACVDGEAPLPAPTMLARASKTSATSRP